MNLGATAGRYRVLGRIAAGGMGEVYRASMETFDGVQKAVALKVVRPEIARDPEFVALFVEEAKVAMSLSHANIVQSFDVGRLDERYFLAMEHIDGVNLATLLAMCRDRLGQPIPQRFALLIVVEALKGLDYAHRRRGADGKSLNIVHRDISPSNVLVSFEGEVKIADFGIAKSALRSVGSVAGAIKGKIPYMSPEQLRGADVDRRADLYSVGAVLYEMLTGRMPFSAEDGTAAIPRVLEGAFTRPREIDAAIPEPLERIVLRALSRAPDARYPNAAAMRQALEEVAVEAGYLLSSSDLADFVERALEDGDDAGAHRDRADAPRPAAIATDRARAGPPGHAGSARDGEGEGEPNGEPFDAILGAELQKVASTGVLSVFTRKGAGRLLDRPVPPPESRISANATEATAVPVRASPRIWAVIAIVLAVAVVATAIGIGVSASPATPATPARIAAPHHARATASPPPLAQTAIPPGIEPPVAPAPHTTPTPAPTRSRPRTPTPTPPPPPAAADPSYLSVNTDPWSYVYVDGALVRATPLVHHRLTPGTHAIALRNPGEGIERSLTVELREGEHRRVTMDLHAGP